jgi:glutathione synthase/RimK-type ligase-like ATP-grasp enzyme
VYDEDITALVGPGLAADGARVVAAIGSAWAGVDVVTDDPGVPLAERGAFLEINTTPGILHHCPAGEGACPTAMRVLERLLAEPA